MLQAAARGFAPAVSAVPNTAAAVPTAPVVPTSVAPASANPRPPLLSIPQQYGGYGYEYNYPHYHYEYPQAHPTLFGHGVPIPSRRGAPMRPIPRRPGLLPTLAPRMAPPPMYPDIHALHEQVNQVGAENENLRSQLEYAMNQAYHRGYFPY